MKSLTIWILGIATSLLPMQAVAQSVTVGSDSGVGGDTVVIPVTFEAGGNLAGIDLDITFDDTQFSAASVSCAANTACPGAFTGCDVDPAGTANLTLAASSACVSGVLGEITLTIDGAATAGDKPLTVTVRSASDPDAVDLCGADPCTQEEIPATDGNVAVLGAAYSSNPAPGQITLSAKQGVAAQQLVAISNTGVAGTTLTGTCTEEADPGGVFTLGGDTSFSVISGDTADVVSVTCDTTADIGQYTGTMECTHNGDGTGEPDPAVYPLVCNILDKDPALFGSDPLASSTTDMTANMDAKAGDTVPPSVLRFANGAAEGSHPLGLVCQPPVGDAQITVTPDLSAGIFIAPGPSNVVDVTFSCDATDANAVPYSTVYSCEYTTDGTSIPAGTIGTADYTYTCDVRAPEATVEPSPAPGTLTQLAEPGGSVTYDVVFSEVGGEGVDGSLDSCELGTGTAFTITSPPAAGPYIISADGSVTVTVTGTDPGGVESATDTLSCTYSDGPDSNVSHEVTYNLVMDIGGDGLFEVTKTFSDDRPGSVEVTLTCNTGLPLTQSAEISNGSPVYFVMTSFESGDMDCTVSEDPDSGYTADYNASGDSENDDDASGCYFTAVAGGDSNVCAITNDPDPVAVTITKEWALEGAEQDEVSEAFVLTLVCDSRIIGGSPVDNGTGSSPSGDGPVDWYKVLAGSGNTVFPEMVVPNFPSSSCHVVENNDDDAVVVENGCMNISVSVGNPAACTITNTAFFEGIPTLNQYGLAIMALLMLGIGMVGFRRFS